MDAAHGRAPPGASARRSMEDVRDYRTAPLSCVSRGFEASVRLTPHVARVCASAFGGRHTRALAGRYCPGGLRVDGRPMDSPLTTNSTRRFCCRPAGVELLATGRLLPNPSASTDAGEIFCCPRYVRNH